MQHLRIEEGARPREIYLVMLRRYGHSEYSRDVVLRGQEELQTAGRAPPRSFNAILPATGATATAKGISVIGLGSALHGIQEAETIMTVAKTQRTWAKTALLHGIQEA